MRSSLKQTLMQGLTQLNLACSPQILESLLDYGALLQRWNRAYNLTAVRDSYDILVKHILDSLSIAPYLTGKTVLDIGTGAGLPGVPLALLQSERQFVLLDSNNKKLQFIVHSIQKLAIQNICLVQARVETFQPGYCFDNLMTRAFGSLHCSVTQAHHLADQRSQFLMMKGCYPEKELAELPAHLYTVLVHTLQVPGLSAQRHLVIVQLR